MATATLVQRGDAVDYIAPQKIAAGDIVQLCENYYGVAIGDAEAGEVAAVSVRGVYSMPKQSSQPIAAGALCYLTPTGVSSTTEAGCYVGRAAYAATAGAATVSVTLNASNIGDFTAFDTGQPAPKPTQTTLQSSADNTAIVKAVNAGAADLAAVVAALKTAGILS